MGYQQTDQRIAWLDVARALGIALVVFGHVERGLQSAGILEASAWEKVDFFIYTFHMPLFFYLSGMNVMRSREKPSFFKRRAKAIVIPYLVFSLLQGAVKVFLSGQTNGSLTIHDLAMIPINPISPYWFLYVLFFYVALVSVWKPGLLMFAFAVLMTLMSPFSAGSTGGFPLFQLMYFLSFYVAGALFQAPNLPNKIGIAAAAIWAMTGTLALTLGADPAEDYYMPYMLPAAVTGSIALIWMSQKIAEQGSILAYIGTNVIAIYVMHILATAGTRIILMKTGVSAPIIHLTLGTLAGVALPLIALWVLQKLRIAPAIGLPGRA